MIKLLTTPLLFFLFSLGLYAQNRVPEIQQATAIISQEVGHVFIGFDLEDFENDLVSITLQASINGGKSFGVVPSSVIGDVGFPITPGPGKILDWNYAADQIDPTNLQVRIVANDFVSIDLRNVVANVDPANLEDQLVNHIEGERHFQSAPDHLEDVREHLETYMGQFDMPTERTPTQFQGVPGWNIVGTLHGTEKPKEVLYLTGHYDGVVGSPAADDNGSAVAGLLDAARVLSAYSFERTIRFVAFDYEEQGLLGSGDYVATGLGNDQVVGVLNLEMIGYFDDAPFSQLLPNGFQLLFPDQYSALQANDFRGDFLTNVGNTNSDWLRVHFDSVTAEIVPNLSVISLPVMGNGLTTPDFRRSDHARFWDAGHSALMLTDGADFRNPFYHSPADSAGHLDFEFMAEITRAATATLADLAGIQHASNVVLIPELNNSATAPVPEGCKIQVYPNPAVSTAQLYLPGCKGVTHLHLTGTGGQSVFDRTVSGPGPHTLELSGIAPGPYWLTATPKNGPALKQLLIRSR